MWRRLRCAALLLGASLRYGGAGGRDRSGGQKKLHEGVRKIVGPLDSRWLTSVSKIVARETDTLPKGKDKRWHE
jgi:hypothetical protein